MNHQPFSDDNSKIMDNSYQLPIYLYVCLFRTVSMIETVFSERSLKCMEKYEITCTCLFRDKIGVFLPLK